MQQPLNLTLLQELDFPPPSLLAYNYSFTFPFEDFDPLPGRAWMVQNLAKTSALISIFYIIFIGVAKWVMRNRPPFDLDTELSIWNFSLAAISAMGFVRLLPEMYFTVANYGFTFSICVLHFNWSAAKFWHEMFPFLKAVELGDTAFLILRKRHLTFLHYYHHASVLLFTWHGHIEIAISGHWFTLVNYLIHSIMYFYFGLKSLRVRVPRMVSILLTTMQIFQMVIGMVVIMKAFQVKNKGIECRQSYENLYFGVVIFTTYFFLFVHFFYQTYIVATPKK